MRILFVSHTHLRKDLGASKVLLELSEEMKVLGWETDLLSLADLAATSATDRQTIRVLYAQALTSYLSKNSDRYDVVDYDHVYLPQSRGQFCSRTLMVARSVLLAHHLLTINIPGDNTLNGRIRALLHRSRDTSYYKNIVAQAQSTLMEADLINVANHGDEDTLIRSGINQDKIAVFPYGLSSERQLLFDRISLESPAQPKVAFVGTFDNRKGATDFPEIVRRICGAVPGVSFRLVGTFRKEDEVLKGFSQDLRAKVEVIPTYSPNSLPELLAACSVGVFPSYLEGFGFGVLEMLAAGIPVVAYDAPGPPMMLPAEYLVPSGDTKAMSDKVVGLLSSASILQQARRWARQRSQQFSWRKIAQDTSEVYRDRWQQKQSRQH